MKIRFQKAVAGLLVVAVNIFANPIGTEFTYQGELVESGMNVTDTCDFEFGLWDAAAGGTEVAVSIDAPNVSVNDGRFTVALDFGAAAFEGEARWLEIAVACPAGGGLTTLTPRQELTPTPNALNAQRLEGLQAADLVNDRYTVVADGYDTLVPVSREEIDSRCADSDGCDVRIYIQNSLYGNVGLGFPALMHTTVLGWWNFHIPSAFAIYGQDNNQAHSNYVNLFNCRFGDFDAVVPSLIDTGPGWSLYNANLGGSYTACTVSIGD